MTPTTYMIWAASGGVVVLLGLALAVYALFWDRARGRSRCPKCAYSMEGLPRLICPECGTAARDEKALLRTRRRWRIALAGLLAVTFGGGTAVWPIARAKEPWSLLPHRVQGWFVVRAHWLGARQRGTLLAAFIRPQLTRSEYLRVIRRQTDLLRRDPDPQVLAAYRYALGIARIAPDGTVSVRAGRYASQVVNEAGDAYALLPDSTAVGFASALAEHWRSTWVFEGKMSARELMVLAYHHPAVAHWALARLFEDPVGWMVYAIDPRSSAGEVFRELLTAYRGSDEGKRARAASALQKGYFAVNEFRSPPELGPDWIKSSYPPYAELKAVAAAAGDGLLNIALNDTGDRRRIAVLALTDHRVVWQAQVQVLQEHSAGLPEEVSSILAGQRPSSAPRR